jgi:hypothetical protein
LLIKIKVSDKEVELMEGGEPLKGDSKQRKASSADRKDKIMCLCFDLKPYSGAVQFAILSSGG